MAVPAGTVHYLEIVTPDVDAVRDLYTEVHGWQFEPARPELGDAYVATLPDGSLCGIRAPMHEREEPAVRTYVRVDEIEVAIDRATEAGAEIALEPVEIPGRGKIAIYRRGGIEAGLWQT